MAVATAAAATGSFPAPLLHGAVIVVSSAGSERQAALGSGFRSVSDNRHQE
jgi:hypothetical protein